MAEEGQVNRGQGQVMSPRSLGRMRERPREDGRDAARTPPRK